MSALLIAPDGPMEDLSKTILGRALSVQTDDRWTLDPMRSDVAATVMVDSDSELVPDAVATIRGVFAAHPDVDVVTADAQIGGQRVLRGAWSPPRVAARPDELDLVAVRGIRDDGSLGQRVEAVFSAADDRIAHLPAALIRRDVALDAAEARPAAAAALGARCTLPSPTVVSVVIPTAGTVGPKDRPLFDDAFDAVRACGADDIEIVVVIGPEFVGDPDQLAATSDVRVVRRATEWNYAVSMNLGLLAASHDAVVLLNDDVELIEPGWALPMLAHLADPSVALVGATLRYPDGGVQHAGMVLDDAFPLHNHVGRSPADLAHTAAATPRDVAAVTAAAAVGRRSAILSVGGFWTGLPASFNDVDLCLKLRRDGRRIVHEPDAVLIHHESASREAITHGWEWDRFVGRWGEVVDPWYHPGFHRPDDPNDRSRNADHLPPTDPDGRWPLRTAVIGSRVHHARLRPPDELETPG